MTTGEKRASSDAVTSDRLARQAVDGILAEAAAIHNRAGGTSRPRSQQIYDVRTVRRRAEANTRTSARSPRATSHLRGPSPPPRPKTRDHSPMGISE